jgi:hypothetical protein
MAFAQPSPEDAVPQEPETKAPEAPEPELRTPVESPPETPEEQARDEAAVPAAPPVVNPRKPWRGSRVTYGHSITVSTFLPNSQPWYDPSWWHHLTLEPEWHFSDLFYVRARLFIAQELTQSDTTSSPHAIGLSDLYLYGGWSGYEEPHTRLKLSGDLLVQLPTSAESQARTELGRAGPSVMLSRSFDVLAGLTIGYGARPVVHLNRLTAGGGSFGANPSYVAVGTDTGPDAVFTAETAGRNIFFHLSHGPFLTFRPHPTVSVDASFWFDHGWMYSLPQVPPQLQSTMQVYGSGVDRRDVTRFLLSVSWQFTRPVGVTLSAFTAGGALAADGTYIFPLFNRFTQLNLDFTLDIEGLTSALQ